MSERLGNFLYPLLTFSILVAIWEISIIVFDVPDYILPEPSRVLMSLKEGYIDGDFWPHVTHTLRSTIIGYLFGCAIAISVGTVLAESKIFEKCFYPFIVALQSMPKVALAPLIIVWFGYGMESKIVMVGLMCFFPVFVNTIVGIKHVDQSLLSMMKSFSANRWLIFTRVKLFSAASHIFAGLQIAVVLSLIGAVVAEFVASSRGIGWLIEASLANFNTAHMFAALFSLIVIGLAGTRLIQFLHGRFVFWDRARANVTITE